MWRRCCGPTCGWSWKARKDLREAIAYADSVHDYVSRDMMIEILADEEGHIDWLETELDLIGKIGLQNYLQSQIKVKD